MDPAPDVVFDSSTLNPKATYIWDLAFDASGRMYVATGGPADIYRVDLKKPGAAPEKFFSSSEQHIRCLLFAKDGTLYAGTDGRGLVYRIDPSGKGFVLFEAPNEEIPAMALDPDRQPLCSRAGRERQVHAAAAECSQQRHHDGQHYHSAAGLHRLFA